MQIQATYSSAYPERDLSPLHWMAKWTKSRRENTLFVSRNEVSKWLAHGLLLEYFTSSSAYLIIRQPRRMMIHLRKIKRLLHLYSKWCSLKSNQPLLHPSSVNNNRRWADLPFSKLETAMIISFSLLTNSKSEFKWLGGPGVQHHTAIFTTPMRAIEDIYQVFRFLFFPTFAYWMQAHCRPSLSTEVRRTRA